MNIGLGFFWSIPAILFLLIGCFTVKKAETYLKVIGTISLLAGGFLFISAVMLLMGWWHDVH